MSTADLSEMTPLQRAVVAMKALRAKLDQAESKLSGPIAVVGLGCRLPGGIDGPQSFWQRLLEGCDLTSDMPGDRWPVEAYYDTNPEVPGKVVTRRGGFLEGIDRFDAGLFGISPREAQSLDPQQRLLLEVAWTALEHAGQAPDQLRDKKAGVFVGIGIDDYVDRTLRSGDPARMDAYSGSGIGLCFASGRLSYCFGSHGPSVSLDTACSSSMVAIHLACQSLRLGESDMALAGGVNLILSPEPSIFLSKAKALAPDGRCKTFDASADGYSRAEGCAVLVFKRLADAQRDGDRILAVVRGSALNHDGPSSGLTVPNGQAQREVLLAALANAGVDPAHVNYVEAHGTGTALGDPIELRALQAVYGKGRPASDPLWVGSVKTNLGHLETGASAVSAAKAVLALHHGTIPAHLHFKQPTSHFDWQSGNLRVPTQNQPWPETGERKRYAAVSAFGLSGTNGHLILEEAPQPAHSVAALPKCAVLKLSAQSHQALQAMAAQYASFLTKTEASFAQVAAWANRARADLAYRASVVGEDVQSAAKALEAFAKGQTSPAIGSGLRPAEGQPKLVFLFTGQGGQYQGMGAQFYQHLPAFRKTLDHCAGFLAELEPELHLLDLMLQTRQDQPSIDETRFTQPALFAFEVALFEMWRSLGVVPDAVMGHSLGEYAAAYAAGVFSLEDGLRLVHRRGQLMQDLKGQYGMLAVDAGREAMEARLPSWPEVSLAAINSPVQTVISGPVKVLKTVAATLAGQKVTCQRLPVSHGFHSDQMEPLADVFPKTLNSLKIQPPEITLIGNLRGRPITTEVTQADYWYRHARQTVRFSEGLQHLMDQGFCHFLEIGPKPVLLPLAKAHRDADAKHWFASCLPKRGDLQSFYQAAGQLYTRGFDIQWRALHSGPAQALDLPTYPFQRGRFWMDRPAQTKPIAASADSPSNDLQHLDALLAGLDEGHFSEAERKLLPKLCQTLLAKQAENRLETLRDHALTEVWEPLAERPMPGKLSDQQFLVLADGNGVAEALADLLVEHGAKVFLDHSLRATFQAGKTVPAKAIQKVLESAHDPQLPVTVLFLWPLDATSRQTELAEITGDAQQLSAVFLAMSQLTWAAAPKLAVVHTHESSTHSASSLRGSALTGAFQSLRLEFPELESQLVALATNNTDYQPLFRALCQPSGEPRIAVRKSGFEVPRLHPATEQRPEALACREDGIYLITGGTGALGLASAHALIQAGASHVILLSRNPPGENASRQMQTWRDLGVTVDWQSLDLADSKAVQVWFQQMDRTNIRGVIHTAGIGGFQATGTLTGEDWRDVFAAKAIGAWALHQHTSGLDLDCFVLFGSIAATWGSKGQVHYAAANASLSRLVALRQEMGLPASCLSWGPWREGGIASPETLRHLDRLGLQPWDPVEGQVLIRQWARYAGCVALARVDWPRLISVLEDQMPQPLLQHLAPSGTEPAPQTQPSEIYKPEPSQWLSVPKAKAAEQVLTYLRHLLSQTLAHPIEALNAETNIALLGLDSLMAADIRGALQRELGCAPSHAQLLRDLSLASLATLVLEAYLEQNQATADPALADTTVGPSNSWQEGEF